MTRTTTILAPIFIILSITLAFVAASQGATDKLDDTLKRVEAPETAPAADPATQQSAPAPDPAAVTKTGETSAAPATAPSKGEIPIGK